MLLTNARLLHDRQHAAQLLREKLVMYKNSDAVVVSVGPGSASVGHSLAKDLNLLFDLVLCRKISHPGNPKKAIGSVSEDQVSMHSSRYDIPQNFLAHQIANIQHEIESDYRFLFGKRLRPSLKDKTVILVGDLLDCTDTLMASLKSIKSQDPKNVIVAVPVVDSHAAARIAREVDDLTFLYIDSGEVKGTDFYESFPPVELAEVKRLFGLSEN